MTAFKHVLVLVVSLAAPQANPKEIETICEFGAGVVASVVAKKLVWCNPFWDKRLERQEEGFGL